MRNQIHFVLVAGFLVLMSLPAPAQQDPAWQDHEDNELNNVPNAIQDSTKAKAFDPDNRPLSGAEDLSPGIPESSQNVLDGSIRIQQRMNVTEITGANSYRWSGETAAFGSIFWNRTWNRHSFVFGYDGGSVFDKGLYSESTHSVSVSQFLAFGRWSLTLSDQGIYAPESTFGLPGFQPTTFNVFGINPALLPNQTVFTGHASRISNASIGQMEYAVSRKTSLTATGSYSLLHYTETSFNENHQLAGTLGYNRAFTPSDKVALTYSYRELALNVLNSRVRINAANLSYVHQVLGRISFQIEGGAQLAKSTEPMSSPRTSVLPDGRLVLSSLWRRTQLSLSGSHAVISGAGLTAATKSTTASLSATRSLSRIWSCTVNVGYAKNSFIGLNDKLQSAFVEGNLEKAMGQHVTMSAVYNFQKQVGRDVCTSLLCAGQSVRHSVGIGFNWQSRPMSAR